MGKLAASKTKTPTRTHSPGECAHVLANDDSVLNDGALFWTHVSKVAGIGRKEWAYDLEVSKTLIDFYFSGERNNPFTQARKAAAVVAGKRLDMLPVILCYVAGIEDFDKAAAFWNQVQGLFSGKKENR